MCGLDAFPHRTYRLALFSLMKSFLSLLVAISGVLGADVLAESPPLQLQCTPSLVPLAKDLVHPLHDAGIEIAIVPEAGNAQVATALGAEQIDVALLTRPLTIDERVSNPQLHFSETTIGMQVVAMVVSRLVWEGGVQALKREQIMGLYENKIRNWKEVGGEERPTQFFEPAHDKGPWEIFAKWVYGDVHKAPAVTWQIVADGADTQSALQFASGAISVAALRWADRKDVFPIALIDDSGKTVQPTIANMRDGSYPLMRPLVAVFPREPAAEKRKLLGFLMGEKGQQIVAAHDYVPEASIKAP
jgi:phosphate transport system substrate-binding protein